MVKNVVKNVGRNNPHSGPTMARVTANNYVHQRSESNNFYYIRDVPKVARAVVGKPRWKISLDTENRAEAIRRACRHRVEHDQLIEDAGTPRVDPITLLSADQRKAIEDAGGVPAFVEWLNTRALEAEGHRSEAESLRDWANEAGPPDEIPDPDWADGKSAAHTAERIAIESQIARNLPILNCLGLTPEKLAAENRPFLANAIKSGIVDPNTITLQGVLDRWKEKKKPTRRNNMNIRCGCSKTFTARSPLSRSRFIKSATSATPCKSCRAAAAHDGRR